MSAARRIDPFRGQLDWGIQFLDVFRNANFIHLWIFHIVYRKCQTAGKNVNTPFSVMAQKSGSHLDEKRLPLDILSNRVNDNKFV